MSMSPKARTRTATDRPYSSRNTRSISDASRTANGLARLVRRTHLDRGGTRPGRLACPGQRSVQVVRPDHPEPADVFLALGERTVRDEHLAIADPHYGGRARRVQPG